MSEAELNVDIPNEAGWSIQSVDSLCSLISRGTAPVYVEHSEVLAIGQRCVTPTEFAPDFARPHSHRAMRNVLQPEFGDVLLNSTGTGTIGRSVVFNAPGAFIVDGHVTVMRPRAELADSRWLNSVLRTPSFQRHLERYCFAGSTNQLELSRTPLRVSRLPTPDIDDQRAMGLVIDTLDTAIHETEAIIAKLKAVKQGLLHDLLTGGIDANGELRPPQAEAPHLYKASPLGWIPQEWDVVTLESVSKTVTSGSRDWARFYADSGALFVRIGNLTREHINFRYESTMYVRPPRNADGQRTRLESGDILISITADLGIIGVVPDGLGEAYINQHIALVRPDLEAVNSRFVGHYLAGPVAQTYISKLNDAGAKAGLNLPTIRGLLTAKPLRSEQDQIAARLDEIDNRIQNAAAESAKLRELKAGLMDDLLTGRVRVTPLLAEATQLQGSV
ncbi:restriction endonuclease subunit S [Acidovorax sp. Leaf160]|uniref:restriction endonuclease subunit S n=1 Tax=Acidovorax sp. Leaf160 TaxID=1736280 RepID=UPI0019108516|nr:restriction endonuclease subunit S [Acidovorax sp. Leaf160]